MLDIRRDFSFPANRTRFTLRVQSHRDIRMWKQALIYEIVSSAIAIVGGSCLTLGRREKTLSCAF